MKKVVVNRNDNVWTGHPDIAYYKDKFYVIFRQSDNHRTKSSTKIMMCSSSDGEKWSEPSIIAAGHRYNCPRLKVINGKMWLACDIINGTGDLIADEVRPGNRIWLWNYNGREWSGPILTNIEGIVPDRIFQDRKGNFLIGAHRYIKVPGEKKFKWNAIGDNIVGRLVQTVWSSEVIGSQWDGPTVVANRDGHNFCEGSIFDMNGYIGCIMRENSRRGDPSYICLSSDYGKRWTSPRATRMMGCHRPVSGMLKSGKLLTTYREQMHTTDSPYWAKNVFACLSNIRTYRSDQPLIDSIILPLDHDNSKEHPDGGYTGWVEGKDDNIVVVNYITNDAPFPYIVCYILSEDEF